MQGGYIRCCSLKSTRHPSCITHGYDSGTSGPLELGPGGSRLKLPIRQSPRPQLASSSTMSYFSSCPSLNMQFLNVVRPARSVTGLLPLVGNKRLAQNCTMTQRDSRVASRVSGYLTASPWSSPWTEQRCRVSQRSTCRNALLYFTLPFHRHLSIELPHALPSWPTSS